MYYVCMYACLLFLYLSWGVYLDETEELCILYIY